MALDLQEIVDALSVRLGQPVLVDDLQLRLLAYSTHFGEPDSVRTASILGRTAPEEAREALLGHGIGTATELLRIPAHPQIGMAARICVPILHGPRRLGYLWLIEDEPLDDQALALAREAASEAASLLQSQADAQLDRRRHEQGLLARLLEGDVAAAEALERERYLPVRPVVVRVGSSAFDPYVPLKHALCGSVGGRSVCVAATGVMVFESGVLVGESDPVSDLRDVPRAYRRALAALQVAGQSPSGVARWEELRAYRLLTALPPSTLDDIPVGLQTLFGGGHEQLVLTLETYLDHAGDAKRTSAALWLHRTSLYYRLRRIEELADVDLNRGEDRLLCHVALRLARLALE